MLKIDLSTCLGVLNILSLACLLLYKLVGTESGSRCASRLHAIGSLAEKSVRKEAERPRGISPVRVIRQHRRSE